MSDDLIKRSDAIEVASRECHEFRGIFGRIEEGINRLPSADRPQGWTPCSERLPSEDGQYLVWAIISFVPDHVDDPSTYQGITIAGYYGNAHPINWLGISVEKVIAWMPLPEPWKGADDEL